jgi:Zn-dependent oligopeptidase
MTNPLLTDSPLPAFGAIEARHVEPAIRQLLDENRAEIAGLLATGADRWDTLVVPLERMHHRLAKAWSPVGHLNGVMNGDELRAAYNGCLPLLTAYHTELGQNAELCAAYQLHWMPSSARWSKTRCVTSALPVSRCRQNASNASAKSWKDWPRHRRSSTRTCSTPPPPGRGR